MRGEDPARSFLAFAETTSLIAVAIFVQYAVGQSPESMSPASFLPSQPRQVAPGQPAAAPGIPDIVADVRVTGNQAMTTSKILTHVKTRKDRPFDAETVQQDKRRLAATGMFRDVKVYTQQVGEGVLVTFEVFERPTIRSIKFVGNRGLSDKALAKESGLKEGEALNVFSIEEARRKVESFYHSKGFPHAQVTIQSGDSAGDQEAVFYISEGPLQRVESVEFVGNTIASDQRLKTLITLKPGFLWYLFRGKVNESTIEEDKARLISYYRSLGFFRARVSPWKQFDESGKWLSLRYIIDEGPRYSIRNVSVTGNSQFATDSLLQLLELQSGQYFNLTKMNADRNSLLDAYGSQGYIFADIQADPRFLEEPGQLDLNYKIEEGNQFRVGRINVHIAGEFPHTQESVILDRLSIRPGDIVDIREVRASERRLKASQLFVVNPAEGNPPRIVIRPPDLSQVESIARGSVRGTVRSQSPDGQPPRREVDLDVITPRFAARPEHGSMEQQDPRR